MRRLLPIAGGGGSALMRHAGLMLPLFSATSSRELGHWRTARSGAAVRVAGVRRLRSADDAADRRRGARRHVAVFGAQSAMAIDPIYIALDDVPDFVRGRRRRRAERRARARISTSRARPTASSTRACAAPKTRRSRCAFDQFYRDEWAQLTTARARRWPATSSRERWWLDDWALYAAIARDASARSDWREWPAPLRDRRRRRDRRGAAAAGARGAAAPVPAVDRRDAVAGRARRARARAA